MILLVISNTIYRLNPKFPLPFIQILLGVAAGLFFGVGNLSLNASLFLALVIAPLNFREGQLSNVDDLKENWKAISYLIFPLVFLTALGVGLFAGYLLPVEVPLPASFALGAALAPTDAVAFLALSKRFAFPKKLETILTLEGLLNDASGLVAFQFALLALTTGTFSLLGASSQFVWALLGGILIGLFFALSHRGLVSLLEKLDAADIPGVLILELSLPLVTYFVASSLGGSGIIAVVIAGLFQSKQLKKITLFDARVNRVNQIIWDTLSFSLNGLVFLVFGYEFTRIIQPALKNPLISNSHLLWTVVLITASLFLIRFVGLLALNIWKNKKEGQRPYRLIDLGVLTFSGMKGSVSIATILLLPQFDNLIYSLILFTVGMVTLLSFVVGLLVLPLLAKPRLESPILEGQARLSILQVVVSELEMDVEDATNPSAIYIVIGQYYKRMERLHRQLMSVDMRKEVASLRLKLVEIEQRGLEVAFARGNVDLPSYRLYQDYLRSLEQDISRDLVPTPHYLWLISRRVVKKWYHELRGLGQELRARLGEHHPATSYPDPALSDLFLTNTVEIVQFLDTTPVNCLQEYLETIKHFRLYQSQLILAGIMVEDIIGRLKPDSLEDLLRGFYLERKVVAEYERSGQLSKEVAKQLRRNINQLESYSLTEFDSF